MLPELINYYQSKEEPNKSCLLTLRDSILEQDDDVSETRKYGMPCFCYNKKMFCYLWTDKKTDEPYILFVEGKLIHHTLLEAGSRTKMKILRINPNSNLPLNTIKQLLNEALNLIKNNN